MESERTRDAVARAHEYGIKFDYFMASLTLAIAGYLMTKSSVPTHWLSAQALAFVAIVLLIASAFLALQRIANYAAILFVSQQLCTAADMIQAIGEGLADPKYSHLGEQISGALLDRAAAAQQVKTTRGKYDALVIEEDRLIMRARHLYSWRDRTMYAGFVIAVIARLLGAELG